MNRREFLTSSTATSGLVLLPRFIPKSESAETHNWIEVAPAHQIQSPTLPDLSPAHWIWYPSGRTLPCTFILFRCRLELSVKPRRAKGWISADSRYRLEVNGRRVQWGPAPSDPRWAEADPIDLTEHLHLGENVLGVTVLFYGSGDGTSPLGKPGLLFWLEVENDSGQVERIASDEMWQTMLCDAWTPGRPKRWYLRALQEEFNANLYPAGWSRPEFQIDSRWLQAMRLNGSPNRPSISTTYPEYMLDVGGGPEEIQLRPRSIPLLRESFVPAAKLAEAYWIRWHVKPRDYFDFRIPNAFQAERDDLAIETRPRNWRINLDGSRAAVLTFEFKEQVVGWPSFVINAPAGTVVELLVHEAHSPGGSPLLNTHFDSWTRFICREGRNEFETFDFESLRWLQLHIHETKGEAVICDVQVRRRVYPWPKTSIIHTSEQDLQRLFEASLNTLDNCAQETLVDGMARERQQYSGDVGHQLHAVHLAYGEQRLVARYLTTWSQGLTKEGFFLDCWPAYDRLARMEERQLDLTNWGPLLDHGVGFNFDCWSHYLYTGNLESLREAYPRLLRFAQYLQHQVGDHGLLLVENLGLPWIWLDHDAYEQQRHKQCAFNLYAAAAMQHALAPICRAFGDERQADQAVEFAKALLKVTVTQFWSRERGMFVNNLPWLDEEKRVRTCDRSLATSILFDQCPGGQTAAALSSLVECPSEMGFSYPANACWRLWALAKSGRVDVVVKDLRFRWATMDSVKLNNTLQEDWQVTTDSSSQWSHCGVVPVYIAFHGLMGLRPIAPGFKRYELRPQLADLSDLSLTAFTVRGPVSLRARGKLGHREVVLELPPDGEGELLLPKNEIVELPLSETPALPGHRRFKLPPGDTIILHLEYV